MSLTDEHWMREALAVAQAAARAGEVPVGAVLVREGELVASGCNTPIACHDPTAHAEMMALRAAGERLGNYRLEDCEMFVTLEPCAMCSGAMLHARLRRVVFGASDPKTGAAGSVLDLFSLGALNHQTTVRGGVLAEECAAPLKAFFRDRRINRDPLREDALRTRDERFDALGGGGGAFHYVRDLPSLAGLRLHYLDQGGGAPPTTEAWLCLHGPGDWSWRYAGRLPALAAAGRRVVAPDLIGFGRSDKLKKASAHSIAWHVAVLRELVDRLGLERVVILAPAASGPLVAALRAAEPQRFVREVVDPDLVLPAQVLDAPYPDPGHAAGPRALGRLLGEAAR